LDRGFADEVTLLGSQLPKLEVAGSIHSAIEILGIEAPSTKPPFQETAVYYAASWKVGRFS
jgi:hypothetical protein